MATLREGAFSYCMWKTLGCCLQIWQWGWLTTPNLKGWSLSPHRRPLTRAMKWSWQVNEQHNGTLPQSWVSPRNMSNQLSSTNSRKPRCQFAGSWISFLHIPLIYYWRWHLSPPIPPRGERIIKTMEITKVSGFQESQTGEDHRQMAFIFLRCKGSATGGPSGKWPYYT